MKWEQRLFAVYQSIFETLLTAHPHDDGFVIVEDDAVLNDPRAFVEEVCMAQRRKLEFYSLYRSPLQLSNNSEGERWWQWWRKKSSSSSSTSYPPSSSSPPPPPPLTTSCMYLHGTVAFYIRRDMMEQIISVEKRRGEFCRFPIDMYISRLGPWYATRRDVVGHLGTGRIGSISKKKG